jgi:hypothetical protein
MKKPMKLHEIQELARRVAALSWFMARLGEKSLPLYALMKKSDKKIEWTGEADQAFAYLKKVPTKKSLYYYTLQPHISW